MKKYVFDIDVLSAEEVNLAMEIFQTDIVYYNGNPKKFYIFWEDDELEQFLYDCYRIEFPFGYYSETYHDDKGTDSKIAYDLYLSVRNNAFIEEAKDEEWNW